MQPGCFTALITPFLEDSVDFSGLEKLVAFQSEYGITGILAVGTTGESPTLSWQEHMQTIDAIARQSRNRCTCIAGAGSNNTAETIAATDHALKSGCSAVLLVDPYYNGPSSLEIRREYVEPVARAFPGIDIIPYVIPGRTGTQLLPEDLAILKATCANVGAVKEATGSIENMRRTRQCCEDGYRIYSGDDSITFDMMIDPEIRGAGAFSVISNIAPQAVTRMVTLLLEGEIDAAGKLNAALQPLFDLVTVKTIEKTPFGDVNCRARNPLPVKTLMRILGMPSGQCRRPLGRMTRNGVDRILSTARRVHSEHPDILQPVADFFGIDIDRRLNDPQYLNGLSYDGY